MLPGWLPLALGALAAGLLVVLGLQLALLARRPADARVDLLAAQERLERELRAEIAESARGTRQELTHTLSTFQAALLRQGGEATRTQNAQIDAFAQQLALLQKSLGDTLATQLQGLSDANARRLAEVRATLESQLGALSQANAERLDEMRRTVDEKLQATLEQRLGESFRQVAERLEQVHKGLGEMQVLAQGVGDLQRVLANVKARGVFGEVQLQLLLEQVLTPEQFGRQVETRPHSRQRVDFALRLPGQQYGAPVWLPIDAKFPRDDYERLLEAQDRADAAGVEAASRALEARLRQEARSIAENYLSPPHTTDFAVLFLPVESLYAEALRRPGLVDQLQRDHKVTLAGPTTLLAMLNALQMGFRTLALERQASEVWKVLGAVKTEFERYGTWVERIREQVRKAAETLDGAATRTNQMRRALRSIEALPEAGVAAVLPPAEPSASQDEGRA